MNHGLYVVMGVAGAGKSVIGSALARAIDATFVEGDDYHPPSNVSKMAAGIPLTDDDRAGWLRAIGQRLREARDARERVVVACSALKRAYRDVLRDAARAPVRFIYLCGGRELIAERLRRRRGHFMRESMLDSQFATLEEPAPDEDAWVVDVSDPPDAIVASLVARIHEGEQ